jgi:hypothetical protein
METNRPCLIRSAAMPRGWCRDDIAPETVAEVLRAQMGAGMPDVFLHVRHAEMQPGLPVTIEADLVIFDGLPGRVRIGQFNFAGSTSWWAHGCTGRRRSRSRMENGFASMRNGKPLPPLLKERANT